METYYRKIKTKGEKVKYEPIGVGGMPDLYDGIWMVNTKEHSKSISSVVWRLGGLKEISDVISFVSLFALEDELCRYVLKLTDENSKEFKEANERFSLGNKGIGIYNISIANFVSLVLLEIGKHTNFVAKNEVNDVCNQYINSLDTNIESYGERIRSILSFKQWLSENNFVINK